MHRNCQQLFQKDFLQFVQRTAKGGFVRVIMCSNLLDCYRIILQWLSAHYSEPVCVADAAALCRCSPNHFMRWFRQMTGQTFIVFLREYRLNAAAEALHTTEDTVLSIAEQCGFENLSYFNREFKAHFGMTPREYRR